MDLTQESTQERYRVTVRYKRISKSAADMQKRTIALTLAEAMRRQRALELAEGEGA